MTFLVANIPPVKCFVRKEFLYNHKELTDEEMYELLENYQGIELCKAILRKAQEK
jgi:hypothetical protein